MSDNKLFSGSFYGYNKNQVDKYLGKLEESIMEKDDQITELSEKLKKLEGECEKLKIDAGSIDMEKQKIANALLKAEEKASEVIKNVHAQAEEEKRVLEETLEKERERIVDMRTIVKNLRSEVVLMLKNFDSSLSVIESKFDES